VPSAEADPLLPGPLPSWFAGARLVAACASACAAGKSPGGPLDVLIAPTGAGKTLAGFLPLWSSFLLRRRFWGEVERKKPALHWPRRKNARGLHTLSIRRLKRWRSISARKSGKRRSPRWALRSRSRPAPRHAGVAAAAQRRYPPEYFLTTPEQLALLLFRPTTRRSHVWVAETHRARRVACARDLNNAAICSRWRLARLWRLAPEECARWIVATVAEPESLARFLVPQRDGQNCSADIVVAGGAAGRCRDARHQGAAALGRPKRAPCARRKYDLIKATRPR